MDMSHVPLISNERALEAACPVCESPVGQPCTYLVAFSNPSEYVPSEKPHAGRFYALLQMYYPFDENEENWPPFKRSES